MQVGGLDSWETKLQTDTELYIVCPTERGSDVYDALSFVVVKTAFGAATHLVLEVSDIILQVHFG